MRDSEHREIEIEPLQAATNEAFEGTVQIGPAPHGPAQRSDGCKAVGLQPAAHAIGPDSIQEERLVDIGEVAACFAETQPKVKIRGQLVGRTQIEPVDGIERRPSRHHRWIVDEVPDEQMTQRVSRGHDAGVRAPGGLGNEALVDDMVCGGMNQRHVLVRFEEGELPHELLGPPHIIRIHEGNIDPPAVWRGEIPGSGVGASVGDTQEAKARIVDTLQPVHSAIG
jgi:hypothetical protein